MAAYEELDGAIGPLKRAAIDAYMCSNNWGGFAGFKLDGDKYVFHHPNLGGNMFGSPVEEVTRPGADGEGGGDWKMRIPMAFDDEEQGKYADEFQQVRDRIDAALQRWTWLPEIAPVHDLVERVRQASGTISLGAVTSGGKVTGGGAIGGNINLIIASSDHMAGGLMTAFKSNFVAQLGNAIGGQHAITMVLGGVLAAEEEIWKGARQTVADLVDQSTKAFDAAAQGGGIDWEVVLRVAGYAVAGATIFAGPGGKAALAVAGLGVKILDAEIPTSADQETVPAPGDDYDSIVTTFESGLDELAAAIRLEEVTLQDNLSANLEQIRADQSSYDLSRPPIMDIDDDSDLGRPDEIRIDPIHVGEITKTYLPAIADELGDAAGHLATVGSLGAIMRDASIGVGQYGPNEPYYDMRYLIYELLKNLQLEITYSAKTLQLAVEDIGRADTGSMDALEKHAAQMRELKIGAPGSIYDPWD